ncbi:MAG: hypothetical protein IPK81_20685 [Rhodospirillales bacterium]|nr:MAG: hypothetical protein IPK81_20685 [Rhodospirillales bacterium]
MLSFLRAIATTGGASAISLLLGLATNKIVAITLGPAGVGLLASYRQLQEVVTGLGTLGGAAGLVQGLSSTEGDARRRRLVAAVWVTMTGIVVFALLLLIGAPALAEHFFRDTAPEIVFAIRCMVVTAAVSILGFLFSGLVNVSGALVWLALANIAASLAGLALAWPLATMAHDGAQLAFLGLILAPVATQLVVSAYFARRLGWWPQIATAFRDAPRRDDVAHFLKFFAANVGAGLLNSASFMALRALIIETDGQGANGLFQAAWILTSQNLAVLMASFGTYLLPSLSAAGDTGSRRRFLDDALSVVSVLAAPLIGIGLLFMPLILRVLYSSAFLDAMAPLRWMLVGNLFSAYVTVLVILLMARARLLPVAVSEALWYGGMLATGAAVFTGYIDPARFGVGRLEALGVAFLVLHVARLAFLLYWSRRSLDYWPGAVVWRVAAASLLVVAAAAWIGWSAREVDWLVSVPAALVVCATPLLLLDAPRRAALRRLVRERLGR